MIVLHAYLLSLIKFYQHVNEVTAIDSRILSEMSTLVIGVYSFFSRCTQIIIYSGLVTEN